MRRPLVWMAVPVCIYCILETAIHVNFIFLLIITLIAFSFIFYKTKTEYKSFFIFLCAFCLISVFIVSANSADNTIVENADTEGIPVQVTGRVKKINRYDDNMYLQLTDVKMKTDDRLGKLKGVLLKGPYKDAGLGDVIMAEGTLLPFESARNEGNFNEKSYYESIGLEAVVKTGNDITVKKTGNLFYRCSDLLRRHFKASFEKASPKYKGELSSVIIGDKSDLDGDVKDLYTENGIAHILAISGLHISFAGMGLYKILRKAGLELISSVLVSGPAILIYVLMTGGSISAWRACVMFIFAVTADVLGRSYDPVSALSTQAVFTLLANPKAITGASFVMSYTAVLSMIICNEAFGNILIRLRGNLVFIRIVLSGILSSVYLFLFMIPVNLCYYGYIPVYSVFLNLLVIPLSAILMPLGIMTGLLGNTIPNAGRFFAGGAEMIFDTYSFLCKCMQNIPFNKVMPGRPGIMIVILFYISFLSSFIIWKRLVEKGIRNKLREPGCDIKDIFSFLKTGYLSLAMCFIPVFAVLLVMFKRNNTGFFISMIDVGQGDCILVHTDEGRNLLFDGGSSNVKNVYKKRIKPFLLSKGIDKIDMILVSHTDADHVNGITELLSECDGKGENKGNIKVTDLVMPAIEETLKDKLYRELTEKAGERGVAVSFAEKGTNIEGRSFSLICLSPDTDHSFNADKNEMSAVYRLETKEISLLLTGDMTEEIERKLLSDNVYVKADFLKTAHHGSNNSSCEAFLKAVSPEAGLVSCGVNNYGHPGTETMKRFEEQGITTYVTKECGQIFIEKKGKNIRVRTLLGDG